MDQNVDCITVKIEPDLVIVDTTGGYVDEQSTNKLNYPQAHVIKLQCKSDEVIEQNVQEAIDNNNNNTSVNKPKKRKYGKKINCTQCDRSFPYTSSRHRHMMQVHSYEKPYKCDICKRSFIDKSAIKIHMQAHSGIRPYRCKICNKPFGHPFNIKKHMLVHNGLRPYKCGECNKTYKHSSHLKRHMKRHNGQSDLVVVKEKNILPNQSITIEISPKIELLTEVKCEGNITEEVYYSKSSNLKNSNYFQNDDILDRLSEVLS